MECNYYNSNIGYFDRLDHVPCVIQELVFILILERIINCYSSNYISLRRTLLIEFYRNPNHSLKPENREYKDIKKDNSIINKEYSLNNNE